MAKYGYEFNPFKEADIKLPSDAKEEALSEIADFVKTEVLSKIGEGKSPVAGGKWKKTLSRGYKKVKSEQSSAGFANLELTGELLDALDVVVNGNKISLQVEGDSELIGKAEGNNIGSYGRDPSSKRERRFIPLEGQKLSKDIMRGVFDILERHKEESDAQD